MSLLGVFAGIALFSRLLESMAPSLIRSSNAQVKSACAWRSVRNHGCAAADYLARHAAGVHRFGHRHHAALSLGRLLSSQLYQVSPHSPTLLSMTSVLLAAVALLACVIPARRASQVNPIEALRIE